METWNYNLAFGTFGGGNGDSSVNEAIGSPVSNSSGEDRPMLYWIVSNEEYREMYHEYFKEFLKSVDIEKIIDDVYFLFKSYVEKDPTAFFSLDEFDKGVSTLKDFCSLRLESITLQLENGETERNMVYVDASGINLANMGFMEGVFGGKEDFMNREDAAVPSFDMVHFTRYEL